VAGFISEWRPASFRNGGRHQIGIGGRIASEFASRLGRFDPRYQIGRGKGSTALEGHVRAFLIKPTCSCQVRSDFIFEGFPLTKGLSTHGFFSAASIAAFSSGPVRLNPKSRVIAVTISSFERFPLSRDAIVAAARISSGDSISAF